MTARSLPKFSAVSAAFIFANFVIVIGHAVATGQRV